MVDLIRKTAGANNGGELDSDNPQVIKGTKTFDDDVTFNGTVNIDAIGGNAGGINYLEGDNTSFENGTVGDWTLYKDAEQSTPEDGTGGSPSVTFAASNSSPLRNTYSGILSKGASNLLGEGVGIDFTIDDADKNQMLTVSFDYSGSENFRYARNNALEEVVDFYSGGLNEKSIWDYTSGDIIINSYLDDWVADGSTVEAVSFWLAKGAGTVGNARLIYIQADVPSGAPTVASSWISLSGVGTLREEFVFPLTTPIDTTNGDKYWWGIEIDITTTNNTVEIQSNNASTTNETSIYLRYIGDSYELQSSQQLDYKIYTRDDSAVNGDVMPWIYDVDNTELIALAPNKLGGSGKFSGSFLATDSSNYRLILHTSSINDELWDLKIDNIVVGPQDVIAIPDPRWPSYDESEVTITEDTAFTIDAVKANLIPYETADSKWRLKFNIYMDLSGSPGGGTPWNINLANTTFANEDTFFYQALAVNGTSPTDANRSYGMCLPNTGNIYLDSATTRSRWNISGDVLLESKPTWATKTAPDVYLAGKVNVDEVAAVYTTDAGNTIANSDAVVDFEDVVKDTHNAVTTGASWKFTAPVSGYYTISSSLQLNETAGDFDGNAEYFRHYAVIDGTEKYALSRFIPPAASDYPTVNGSVTVYVDKDSYIQIEARQSSGVNKTLSATGQQNYVSIVKIPSPQEVANAALTFSQATEDRPGLVYQSAWSDFTPNSTGFTGTFTSAKYRRDGPDLLGRITYTCDGNETGGSMYIETPAGQTIDVSDYGDYTKVGDVTFYDVTGTVYAGTAYLVTSNSRIYISSLGSGGTYTTNAGVDMDTTSNPFEAVSGDIININFRIQISGW